MWGKEREKTDFPKSVPTAYLLLSFPLPLGLEIPQVYTMPITHT